MGTYAGQAATGSAGGDRGHALPAAGSGSIHDSIPAAADPEPDLYAIWSVPAGLSRNRRRGDQWSGVFDRHRLLAGRFLQGISRILSQEVWSERGLYYGIADLRWTLAMGAVGRDCRRPRRAIQEG